MAYSSDQITQQILQFRDARDWEQYQTPRNLAMSLNIEASELLELFLWKEEKEVDVDKLKDELADVFYAAFLLAHHFQLDVPTIIANKLAQNEAKYPKDKAQGSNLKHDQL